ncbi:uncharacterized protein PITG_21973 [Phytophthora infestans T30-4]|uniref:Uncharacterized protein n=1 Tax=Phytophthora infestans (strain T30-4) TaxID=403677 RepID=D0P4T2_PHYIT|nr:uncharacterized protein PITG_21973 [Phytophthora infestans T30-4]EEY69578.1 conserved hypothetical protein [Phytophthora infestans T30-4]|eukprot:XP_002996869.1 conserved hypothetical protein [Phytophthora infestans T30-4]
MARSPLSPTDLIISSSRTEAKKRRHRENMARGRSRHNALMESMRKQYQNLHTKLETGMVAWRMRRAADNSNQSEQHPPSNELMAQYIDALETENAIHRENEALAQRLEQMAIFETTLRVDTPEVMDTKVDTEQPAKTVQALNRPGFYQCLLTCYNLIQPVQLFGWTVQRYLSERRTLEFHFMKHIPCSDSEMLAQELAIEGWRVFNNPEMYRKCYRSAIDVRVLQRVDAYTTILMRNSPDANENGHKSLSILTLVVPPPEDIANSNRNCVIYLRDAYTYMRFDMFDDHVQFSYGGHGDCMDEAQARYLFVETGNVLFRFEQMIRRANLVTLG